MKKNVSVNLPKPAQFALVALATLLLLVVGWTAVLGPKQHTISDLKAQTALVQQQIADDLTRAATARGASSTPTLKVADFYKLQTAMPSATDMPDLLLELDQTAKSSGVTLLSLAPSAATDSGSGYSIEKITLSATGNFYALTDLLYRLRNLVYVRDGALQANGRLFSVSSVSLSPSNKLISAQIALSTYVYDGTQSSTAPPAGATTSTTSTTGSSTGPSAAGATP